MAFLIHVLGSRTAALTTAQQTQLAYRIHHNLGTETDVSPHSVDVEAARHESADMRDSLDDVLSDQEAFDVDLPTQSPSEFCLDLQGADLDDVYELFSPVRPGSSPDGLSRADRKTETAAK